jgi:phosphoglycolate phosphatase-like HAD superfamily hydrolase
MSSGRLHVRQSIASRLIQDERLEAILFDIGGTLVVEAAPGTPTDDLVPILRPGVAADLGTLSHWYRLGAATNTAVMREPEVRALLARAEIDHYFQAVVTSSDVGASKPDPRVLLVACKKLAVDPATALYVGDRSIDEEAASAAGMFFVNVGSGGLLDAVHEFTARAQHQSLPHAGSSD